MREADMKFHRIGSLTQWYEVGIVYDDTGPLGSAIRVNGSGRHPDSISVNDKALRVASVSFNFMYFSYDAIENFLPMKEAIDIIHAHGVRPYPDADYRVVDKVHIKSRELPDDELPF